MLHPSIRSRQTGVLLALIVLTILANLTSAATAQAAAPPASQQSSTNQPSLTNTPSTGDPLTIALDYLHTHHTALGLTSDDLSDVIVVDRYVTQHNGVTHLYLRQRLAGIEVLNGDININLLPDGRILNLGNRFVSDLRNKVNATVPAISAIDAAQQSANLLGVQVSEAFAPINNTQRGAQPFTLNGAGLSADPIPVKLVYQPLEDDRVRLAWSLVIRRIDTPDWLEMQIDTESGSLLTQHNWTVYEKANEWRVASGERQASVITISPDKGQQSILNSQFSILNSYLAYALPAGNPFGTAATVIENPADVLASPFGWHDVNGVAGAEYTTARGNNAFAYADLAEPDGFNPPSDQTVDGGANALFSFTADLTQAPDSYRQASITNLFYVANTVHDLLYHYGFDEASGNFQQNNYGRAGFGDDAVRAEAQDFSGVNNANFATPNDGIDPRMQMYLGGSPAYLEINNIPALAGRDTSVATGAFGPIPFSTTGNVVLVNDGDPTGGSVNDGCQTPFVNASDLNGKLALIDRGNCTFKTKVRNAELNGAIGVIIANNQPTRVTGMGPDATVPDVNIGSVLVSQASGTSIKTELARPTTVNTTIVREVQRDGALDNEVIIHEYGHGLSNRLTGGPNNSSCLLKTESAGMGEGWSDFLSLVLTARPGDTRTTPRVLGNWLAGFPSDGAGIRRLAYTTDATVNPHTFATLLQPNLNLPVGQQLGEVHDTGEVWATMLWEIYWNLVDQYGFQADLKNLNAGNSKALQLVIDGMKFQPCNPTFTEARDAILAADRANNPGANNAGANQCLIWQAFAKRGLGVSAVAGNSSTVADSVQSFDLPPECVLDIQPRIQSVCAPNAATYNIRLGEFFTEPADLRVNNAPAGTLATLNPTRIVSPTQSLLTIANTNAALPGSHDFSVTATGESIVYTTTLRLNIASGAPNAPALIAPSNGLTETTEQPIFSWNPVPQAVEYVLQLAEDANFASTIYTATVFTTTVNFPARLRAERTYYWRVSARNPCGSNLSSTAQFTVRSFPSLLLVDDDSQAGLGDSRAKYENALNALGIPYDVWDTGENGTSEPLTTTDIIDYSTIVWFNGFAGDGLQTGTEAVLGSFLDRGRCLLISAQDYYATNQVNNGPSPFMQTYLGVAAVQDDLSNGASWQTIINGVAPIFRNLGPYSLTFAGNNYSDLITPTLTTAPGTTAGVAFMGNAGNAGVYKDGRRYRTLYWGFPWESLPTTTAQQQTLQRALQWCDFQTDLGLSQSLSPRTTLRPGQEVSYTLSFSNTGVITAEQIILTHTLPLVNPTVVSVGVPITRVQDSPMVWQVGDLGAYKGGGITIVGRVDPKLTADTSLSFRAVITSKNFDLDLANNQTQTETLTAIVPRLRMAETAVVANEPSGVVTLTVQIDQPNPYTDVLFTYRTITGTAELNKDYTVISGTKLLPAGALNVSFPITLVNDVVMEPSESFQVALSNVQGAALVTPTVTTVTINDSDLPYVYFGNTVYTITEATGLVHIPVRLAQPYLAGEISVLFQTSDGTAKTGLDYTGGKQLLTFAPGTTLVTATVPISDDLLAEGPETIRLALTEPVHAQVGPASTANLLLVDNELPPVLVTVEPIPSTQVKLSAGERITYSILVQNLGDTVSNVMITATTPTSSDLLVDTISPAATIDPSLVEIGQAANAEGMSDPLSPDASRKLVWRQPTLARDQIFRATYAVLVVDGSRPLVNSVQVSVNGVLLPVVLQEHNAPRLIYLPVAAR